MERLDLPPRIISALRKARISSMHQVICMSAADLERSTKLSITDVQLLQQVVSAVIPRPPMQSALEMYQDCLSGGRRVSVGCPVLDKVLKGGLLCHGITEITGESASGKTQLCLQLCLSVQLPKVRGGLEGGALYISTEDVFPSKRLHQLIPNFLQALPTQVAAQLKLGDNIFIEHASDVDELKDIIYTRLPILLSQRKVQLVVIDSVTALFRVEFGLGEMSYRGKVLRSFGAQLHKLSHDYQVAVVCVNQVSDVVNGSNTDRLHKVIPALGLAWSSMVTVRLMLSRTEEYVHSTTRIADKQTLAPGKVVKRLLSVVFAPHLPSKSWPFVVQEDGVHGIQEES
ncbi:DNA repair protein XRCC3 isoform X1 [Nematostella vectensis]|uniref:DNA repair protein XRCC3 isoform X1 n=1 Tax=Nematostella vectensis TaxID=45351 RepID=UPI00207705D4|nr:DNA repair protein XRCC3 isoform X1 [Nematostella vectensis]